MKQGLKKAAIAGIVGEILYFISMVLFLITQTEVALTFWETMTVAGAMLLLMGSLMLRETASSGGLQTGLRIWRLLLGVPKNLFSSQRIGRFSFSIVNGIRLILVWIDQKKSSFRSHQLWCCT